jgi:peptidase E
MDVINKCLKRQEKLMFIPNVSDDIATDEYEEMKRKQDADRQK